MRYILSIIIPVFNEKKYISEIISKVNKVHLEKEIIIVDDYSTDGTTQILKKIDNRNIKVIFHKKNMGKAKAVKTGLKNIKGDIVIIQDADLEYDPMDYIEMMERMKNHHSIAIYGNRFNNGFVDGMTVRQKCGNLLMTSMFNIFAGVKLRDMETCYKMFRREHLLYNEIESSGFGIDPEITFKILNKGIKIVEIPIKYIPRKYSQGKKVNLKDGMITLLTIFKYGLLR